MSTQYHAPPAGAVEVTMFGETSLRTAEGSLSIRDSRSVKPWSVLCYLILNRDRAVPQAELFEAFWSQEEQKNPASALKMLIMRARALFAPLFPEGVDPIVSRRGSYQWNPEIPCSLDVDRFFELCEQAEEAPSASRGDILREAVSLVQGELLPQFSGQSWVLPLSERCRSLYLKAVTDYAELLEARGDYAQMEALCLRAGETNRLDERLCTLVMRSMVLQGKGNTAQQYYSETQKLLYSELGVRPSDELRQLNRQISKESGGMSGSLDSILSSVREERPKGAYCCEPGVLHGILQLQNRQADRSGLCTHVALLTLSTAGGRPLDARALEQLMDALLNDLLSSLRQGDVVSRIGANQYIIMLTAANLEDSQMVMRRITSDARRRYQSSALEISCELSGLDLG